LNPQINSPNPQMSPTRKGPAKEKNTPNRKSCEPPKLKRGAVYPKKKGLEPSATHAVTEGKDKSERKGPRGEAICLFHRKFKNLLRQQDPIAFAAKNAFLRKSCMRTSK